MERPKLRAVEAFPVKHNGQPMLCLRDPQGITEKIISVSVAAAPILQCLNGKNSLADIQQRVARTSDVTIPLQVLETFIDQLDEALLLESPRFDEFFAQLLKKFRDNPVRAASLAGASYPAKPADIHRLFEKHFEPPKGPGLESLTRSRRPAALVIPHIDLRVGGPSYAWAYAQVRQSPPIDTFVILGVAHSGIRNRFSGTKKNFQTPLGTMPTDQAFLDALAGQLKFELYADELAQRNEHSIEFQVVYLQHILGSQSKAQIVPILTGSFHDLMEAGTEPIRDKQVAGFAKALHDTIAESGKHVCVIASVDLAHVGGRFGDEFTVNESVLKQLEVEDREMLAAVAACDAKSFCHFIYNEQDRRRVDAWPAVYTLLHAIDVKHGKLLHYDQNHEHDTNSVVTFASLRLD